MPPRNRRYHATEGAGPLASLPLDGGGVRKVEVFQAALGTPNASALVYRPTFDDGSKPKASLALAHVPPLEPAALAEDAPLRANFEFDGTTARAQVTFQESVHLYGGGEAAGPLLRNGRACELWNTDAYRYGEATPALYQSHPLALALRADGTCVAVIGDSIRRGQLVFATDGVEFAFEAEPFDVWVLQAPDPRTLLAALTELTGRIELPPLWALGYHQCRWSYASAEEVRELAAKLRSRRVPCDAIWLDIDYMDRFRCFTWDKQRFPEPAKLVDELHEQGFRVVTILDPGIAIGKHYPAHKSGVDGEHFVLAADGKPLKGRVWPGLCLFPDFTRPETRAWWAGHVERFLESGVDGLWNDMNEPSVFRTPSKTLPANAVHRGLGGGEHAKFHNIYGQLMAEATRDGMLQSRPTQRPFVLTRAAHLSGARHAATWTGDNQATWDDLRWSIAMVLSLGLSGQPFAGPDIGGFDGDPSGELFARWFELGSLLPFARGHGEKTSCRKEPWSFGAEVERAVKGALERRMRLLPTLYTLFEEATRSGCPIVRPMFFADPADRALREIDDQFLLGPDLIVAPVVQSGATQRSVVLPASETGGWYLFEGGKDLLPAGRYVVDAPLGKTPIFARAGRIIVTKPVKQHSAAQRDEDPELNVFFDARQRASGTLYEDDGETRGAAGRRSELSARIQRGRVVIDAFVDGAEVLDRAWHVHACGAPGGAAR